MNDTYNKIPSKKIKEYSVEGTFGDKEVHICRCDPHNFNGINVILLHGVHSSANMSHKNKFRYLASLLLRHGFRPWLVETSRIVRDRDAYTDNVAAWINDAFHGKCYREERDDVLRAFQFISNRIQNETIWVWGFSLGGINALYTAIPDFSKFNGIIDTIILSGSGIASDSEQATLMMRLPILSSLEEDVNISDISKVKLKKILSFRGSHDEIFTESACRQLLSLIEIPEQNKFYYEIKGAGHSFRKRDGIPDLDIMTEMLSKVLLHSDLEIRKDV